MSADDERRYTVHDLAAVANRPRRTVEDWIASGLLPRPVGRTRAAYYTERHMATLRLVLAAKAKNKTLADLAREAQADFSFAFRPDVSTLREAA